MRKKKKNGNPIARELIEEACEHITEEDAKELMQNRKIPEELEA